MFPKSAFYGAGYEHFGLFGKDCKTIMAHCIYSGWNEIDLMQKNGVYVAHCPSSNMNLASGIAPIRKYLEMGIHVGLGSDVAAGETESIFHTIAQTIQVSKLYWRLVDQRCRPLSFVEAFWMATIGGGEFFGKVGSFAPGYEFDAIVLDDSNLCLKNDLNIEQRIQRDVYLQADNNCIIAKFVSGRRLAL